MVDLLGGVCMAARSSGVDDFAVCVRCEELVDGNPGLGKMNSRVLRMASS